MLGFPKDYPDARILYLEENYRSGPAIVASSLAVISENRKRYAKALRSMVQEEHPVEVMECADMETQMLCLVKAVKKSLAEGTAPGEIAVLTRTNTEGRQPWQKLTEFQIPCRIKDAAPLLWDHWIAGDFIAYLRLSGNTMQREDFLRVCNRPNRYITRKSVYAKAITFEGLRAWYRDQEWMAAYLDRLEDLIKSIKPMRPYAAINYIRKAGGYDRFLEEYARKRRIDGFELIQIADEIQDSSKGCESLAAWMQTIEAFRQKREEEKRQRTESDAKSVTIATLHSAKGLEFTEVFLINVNEEIIPYRKAVMEQEIEEERRLFYVGMTRAKQKLHLYYVRERYHRKMQPSRFLAPIRNAEKPEPFSPA
jgi:DNA helicase-2/ATP-dependent DNA helicase PcrA